MTDYVTPTTWEQCAAHVEAGGIVEVFDGFDEWLDEGVGPSGFRSRPRGPGIGTWEAPRRLVPIETEAYRKERRAIDVPDGYEAVWLPSETVDEFDAGEDDRVSRGHVVAGAREAQARRGTTPAPPPAPSPVPPWPGAVLSGLTDEDGVPTWLAQAGQVRGEQVRKAALSRWTGNIAYGSDQWVEVRAPRTVPVPETERVPWWEANDRELVDGLLCVENAMIREVGREGDRVYVCGYEDPDNPDEDDRGDWKRNYWFGRDGFDGTVEVLKDGDR